MEEMIPFLRMIAENPDDDAPRLVFADWLDEHDMHKRAEFIRLQIELARMNPSDERYPEKTAQMRRCGIFTMEGKYPFFDYLPDRDIRIEFHRGFIDTIHARGMERFNLIGSDYFPLQTLNAEASNIIHFRHFTNLKRLYLEYYGEGKPFGLLEMFGPNGCFNNLEQLLIQNLSREDIEVGGLSEFYLPKLQALMIRTEAFYYFGAPIDESQQEGGDDFDYANPRPWNGLADYLPRNIIPNLSKQLERFIWYSEDDSDFFGDAESWYWRGLTMESLLSDERLSNLKQLESSVYYDDHECGSEGKIAAPYEQSPFASHPNLERITLGNDFHTVLNNSPTGSVKSLRLYLNGASALQILQTLALPACQELESLYIEDRDGWGGVETLVQFPAITFSNLKYLRLSRPSFDMFVNCEFPNLISLHVYGDPQIIVEKNWPQLQYLHFGGLDLERTQKLVTSNRCPNLTTLAITVGEGLSVKDYEFLAKSKTMPHLSLIEFGQEGNFIIKEGEMIRCRSDIVFNEGDMFDNFLAETY